MAQRFIAFIFLLLLFPLFLLLYLLVRMTSKGPFLFTQTRMGKNNKPFIIYKIRTMKEGSHMLQTNFRHLNEADGPVFKIRHDPRLTPIGKVLTRTGLDELPQLLNIVKGEMAFVGPRPFPPKEAEKISPKYQKRFSILPGITSLWAVSGGHERLTFTQWMELDEQYRKNKSKGLDLLIIGKTLLLFLKKR